MARSTYIYHVRKIKDGELLASFTVKHEAHTWAEKHSGFDREALKLSRSRDGLTTEDKSEVEIPWEWPTSKSERVAHQLAEHFRKTGQYRT